ncbi:MAG: tetratricopeptide repeat protein [Chthoniobacteraceae bacterium]
MIRAPASALIALAVVLTSACAQQNAIEPSAAMKLAAMHNAAMQAFNAGDFAAAADGLEKVIAQITDPLERAKIAPLFYTLGAAYFNAKNYAKAADTFGTYVAQYPQAERVGEARLAIARALFMNKDYATAAKRFAELESVPALREQALSAQAACYKALGQPDEQIRILEKIIAPEIKTAAQASAGVTLAELYLSKNLPDKVLALANSLHAKVALVDNVVALNAVTVKLGDELAAAKNFTSALAAYRIVRTREQVIAFQAARIAAMEKRMQENLDRARGNPQAYMAAQQANEQIKLQLVQAKQLHEELGKLPDYMPGVVFRMAKAWYDWDRKWEAIVVFDRLLADYAEAKEAEPAMYSMIVCYADLARIERTQKLCEAYLERFPNGANANTVGYLLGATSLQANDPKKAATFFGTILEKQPDSQFREQMRLGLGNAHFMQGEFEKAREQYRKYLADFPKGQFAEEVAYREALATLFLGEYEPALAALNTYLQAYPAGAFAADAGYRVMVCKYAGSLYDEVIADAQAWHAKFGGDQIAGEVFSLEGDALAAQGRTADAAKAYTDGCKAATSDEVLNYALFEASKQLQKLGQWPEVARMFEEFVTAKPEHPTVVAAMFWIGKAKAREGKTEEAKTFLVEQLRRYLNEPKREAVEQLLQQLAQLCAKRPRGADSAATPAPYDAIAELKKQLAPLEAGASATGKARLLYAEAELAKLLKKDADVQRIYAEIAGRFKPGDLSPVLLATVGEALLAKGERDRTAQFFELMRTDFPKSDYLDYAFVGLGEIAMAKGDHTMALELFTHAADEIAGAKIKDATMGRARALLALGRHAEAKKLFEQVAGIREWRGESTAAAIFYLGEAERMQGRWAEAIAHYQRVFVAYQKFLPWAAKAYVRSAESFDKLGRRKEAIGHLQEMMRNEKLRGFPETKEAGKLLGEWGAA